MVGNPNSINLGKGDYSLLLHKNEKPVCNFHSQRRIFCTFVKNFLKMLSGRAKRKLSETDPYMLVPVPLFHHEMNDSGNIELHIPKFKNQTFGKLFLRKKSLPCFVTELDPLGTRVYKHLNGVNTVKEIISHVRTDGKETIEQLEERTITFLQQLFNYKYITFKQLQT
jgi:hypothetical protein